ncbi:hypothetical protein M911_01590 [Ectothiorhodospira haloalkaliphila]|uniref:Uncharacterized protein n=1 Tax=Ectothiorhodospira haloalkaliphila TaxID=421628 RepID=W8KMA8_9GAMM|nr:hypothetical protein [Ectothiorhodospira haloalkaliphila]AHK78107.1 hypothetical protein M911_01590 [Ectothiorhodospira haloalkaliphila]
MALTEVIAALEAGQPLPGADRDELLKALKRYRRGDGFHLAGFERVRRRNAALLRAAEAVGGSTPWTQAGRLAASVARFEARVLPRYRDQPPASPVDRHLWDAWQSGARPLRSRRRLYELIRD